ncbi:adenosylmethionine--8-amino-7-oxononanoate transaminase [Amphiplicatus metriothermophilus]|uniref:Adenosylmethionine-8-amino-7-oxononanoate aminotransferase n=1 Tax=Amphiplicatus metriothermophilus TaxID=1519374 RepID=A0A239PW77_9PROT|nr:adenosylmethionine--8-amino-7-oxononanoate transaminase [Amphiplicatus metriothermophilus]MBB5519639.1 adenosylmethionine-8-amino-7-oxononanoate aminotransferase [Amphiplicatus metriothermophilus]SNT74202.1 adenosylmethionine-8-amino-7-oxononanoate aminotransferase [Amphiplicatus metriothermophilus]
MTHCDPDWLDEGLVHLWRPYTQMKTAPRPLPTRATRGSRIVLADGRELVDGIASWWTAVHGYNHPALLDAAARQLSQMPHVMLGGLVHEQACRLAARLAAIAPGDLDYVFFSESGSVAVEVAMKMAVQYWRNLTGETRARFACFRGGYHGDTFATMSVCDPEEGMHALFADALPVQHVADLPTDEAAAARLETLLAAHDDIAAVIVEPLVQGAGGMRMHDAATLRRLRALCDAAGVLLIFDEIFTGFGRTGAMFAAEKAGVAPDVMTLGKALTGGVAPLAATVASRRVFEAFYDDDPGKALMHGPTYTGHALGCAVANASLDLFEREPRLAQVEALEKALRAALGPLAASPAVADVRVLGAVGAVETARPFDVEALRAWFIERGVFIRPLGQAIYLAPAYTIGAEDLAALARAVADAVERLEAAA